MYVKTLLRKHGKGDALVGIGWSTARTPLTLSLALQKSYWFTVAASPPDVRRGYNAFTSPPAQP